MTETEVMRLDSDLRSWVRRRLGSSTAYGDDVDDIANQAWVRVLHADGVFGELPWLAKRSYLQRTALNHMLNLFRMERQRARALERKRDVVIDNGTAVALADVYDHIAMLYDWGVDDARYMKRLRSRFGELAPHALWLPALKVPRGVQVPRSKSTLAYLTLVPVWRSAHGCDEVRCRCQRHRCKCVGCRIRWHHLLERGGVCTCLHPVCSGVRMFLAEESSVGIAEALRRAAKFVDAQVFVTLNLEGGHCCDERDCCCRCCCHCCCCH